LGTAPLFRELYDNAIGNMQEVSIPQLILILADYQYKAAFVADQEINIMAALTEIMAQCKFK
jgi:replication factor C small subunit